MFLVESATGHSLGTIVLGSTTSTHKQGHAKLARIKGTHTHTNVEILHKCFGLAPAILILFLTRDGLFIRLVQSMQSVRRALQAMSPIYFILL